MPLSIDLSESSVEEEEELVMVECERDISDHDSQPSVYDDEFDSSVALLCDRCHTNNVSISDMTSKEYYYDSYARFSVHEEMLKDELTTLTFRSAMLSNKHLFKDKIVLDIGCGTGILSMFAVESGAQHVIGIEGSGIAEKAQQIIADNHFDGRITIIKGAVEEVTLPNGIEKVDIIISEWMGYCLFYDSMLDTLIKARDKWLKPDGLIFPDRATLYINGFEDINYKDEKINWWYDVYGFDMSCIRKLAINKAYVHRIEPNHVVTNSCPIKIVDLYTAVAGEATFQSEFELRGKRNDCIHGFAAYFTVQFTKCHTLTGFSTSAESHISHWKQTVFYLDDLDCFVGEGQQISGLFQMVESRYNKRHLFIRIIANVGHKYKYSTKTVENYYKML